MEAAAGFAGEPMANESTGTGAAISNKNSGTMAADHRFLIASNTATTTLPKRL